MRYNLKSILLILATCATIVERLPGISLTIGFLYLVISFYDNFFKKKDGLKYKNSYKITCNTWLILFFYLTIVTIVMPCFRTDVPIIDFKWIRTILFFILIYRDTVDKVDYIRDVLFCYAITAIICAILMNLGIGVGWEAELYESGTIRLSFLGTNANKMSMIFVYAATIVIFYFEKGWRLNIDKKYRFIISVSSLILLLVSIALTGSRGGLICFCLILFYYIFIFKYKNTFYYYITVLLFLFFILHWIIKKMTDVEVLAERFLEFQSGDFGERDVLVKIGMEIFINNPIFGIGMNAVPEYINQKIGAYLTTHNIYVYILAAGGIIGFLLFLFILYIVCKTIYLRSFRHRKQFISVALLLIVLIDWMKNGGALIVVINYIMLSLAYSIADSKDNIET